MLLLDTETTVDETQRLTFGFYRLAEWREDDTLACVGEGMFYGDDLPTLDPCGYSEVQRYAVEHRQDTTAPATSRMPLLSRRDFVEGVFYAEAYSTRSMVVGFNLSFDLNVYLCACRCHQCGTTLTSKRKSYCNDPCRAAALRRRRRMYNLQGLSLTRIRVLRKTKCFPSCDGRDIAAQPETRQVRD